jgi:hypothetical protein
VQPFTVVEGDPVQDLVLGVLEGGEAARGDEFALEGRDPGFGHRIVVGIAAGADRGRGAEFAPLHGGPVPDVRSAWLLRRRQVVAGLDEKLHPYVGRDPVLRRCWVRWPRWVPCRRCGWGANKGGHDRSDQGLLHG